MKSYSRAGVAMAAAAWVFAADGGNIGTCCSKPIATFGSNIGARTGSLPTAPPASRSTQIQSIVMILGSNGLVRVAADGPTTEFAGERPKGGVSPSMPFPVILPILLLGAVVFLVNRMYGENYMIKMASWIFAAVVSILLTLWVALGFNPFVAYR